MWFNVKQLLKYLSTRVFILYLAVFLLSLCFVDYKMFAIRVKVATLNRFRPTSFKELTQVNRELSKAELIKYRTYYLGLVNLMENKPGAHGILAFCYHRLGQDKKAIESYKKAIGMFQHYFWFNYNLGLIYYEMGNYKLASDSFKQALNVAVNDNLMFITTSKTYYQVLVETDLTKEDLINNLKAGYNQCAILLLKTYDDLGDYPAVIKTANFALSKGYQYHGLIYFYAGKAAYKQGNYSLAASLLAKSLERYQLNPQTYEYLGETLQKMGKEREGMDFLNKGMALKAAQVPEVFDTKKLQHLIF